MSEDRPSVTELRADLWRAAEIDDLTERTLEVVAVIEEAAAPLGIHPTLVGGMAVYFWTESDAFLTYDIDVVMAVPDPLAAILAQLGSHAPRTVVTGNSRAPESSWRRQAPTSTPVRV